MSQTCPLCGKAKSNEQPFCSACHRKMRDEYELNLPSYPKKSNTPVEETIAAKATPAATECSPSKQGIATLPTAKNPKRSGRAKKFFVGMLIVLLLAAGIWAFYQYVWVAYNQERAAWENALNENSPTGFVTYMNAYPSGKHFEEAQKRMMELKGNEHSSWETLKTSDDMEAFQLFLKQYPNSPYKNLVLDKVDSLSWIASMNVNTEQAYADYLELAKNKMVKGGFSTSAQERYNMLHQTYPTKAGELDTLRAQVKNFYTVLSESDYMQLHHFLAPKVYRFFTMTSSTPQAIVTGLSVKQSKSDSVKVKFLPDIRSLQYEKTVGGGFKVNIPLSKTTVTANNVKTARYGYIAHIEWTSDLKIIAIFETKPDMDAF